MKYLSVADMAKKWNLLERSVRNYCAKGRVDGANLMGKTWQIPENAEKPERVSQKKEQSLTLLDIGYISKMVNSRNRINEKIIFLHVSNTEEICDLVHSFLD